MDILLLRESNFDAESIDFSIHLMKIAFMIKELCAVGTEGKNFEDLARKHSSCLSAESGGNLGWVTRGMGLPEMLEQAIFDADVKEVFTADSKHGVHILQVLEERYSVGSYPEPFSVCQVLGSLLFMGLAPHVQQWAPCTAPCPKHHSVALKVLQECVGNSIC